MLALTEAVEISLGGVTFQAAVDHKIRVRKEKNRWRFRTFAPSYIKTNGKEETKEAAGPAVPLARAVYQTEGTEPGDRSVNCYP